MRGLLIAWSSDSVGSSDSARSSYYSHSSITGGLRTTTGLASMTPVTSATSETQLLSTFMASTFASSAFMPSHRFTEGQLDPQRSNILFADSPLTLSQARAILPFIPFPNIYVHMLCTCFTRCMITGGLYCSLFNIQHVPGNSTALMCSMC